MQFNDIVMGIFEFIAAVTIWFNVYKIIKDKIVAGMYWPTFIFYTVWAWWSLYYYFSVGHFIALFAAIILAAGDTTWVLLAWKYSKWNNRK